MGRKALGGSSPSARIDEQDHRPGQGGRARRGGGSRRHLRVAVRSSRGATAGWDPKRAAAALRRVTSSDESAARVAREVGEVVGMCVVYLDIESVRFGRRAWIEDMAVHPERRSSGIGTALPEAAKDWGRSRGATHLELGSAEARADAHRFYESARPTWRSVASAGGWGDEQHGARRQPRGRRGPPRVPCLGDQIGVSSSAPRTRPASLPPRGGRPRCVSDPTGAKRCRGGHKHP